MKRKKDSKQGSERIPHDQARKKKWRNLEGSSLVEQRPFDKNREESERKERLTVGRNSLSFSREDE